MHSLAKSMLKLECFGKNNTKMVQNNVNNFFKMLKNILFLVLLGDHMIEVKSLDSLNSLVLVKCMFVISLLYMLVMVIVGANRRGREG